jgi:hypothetical protein
MLTPEQLDELEAFDGGEARVLSVYLDLDPARQVRRSYLTVFADLVKEAREKLTEPARAELSGEASRVQAWLEDLRTARERIGGLLLRTARARADALPGRPRQRPPGLRAAA